MKKILTMMLLTVFGLSLAACASIKLNSKAAKVIVSTEKAPSACHYLGMVTSNQGNFFTGAWTSNQNLQQGSFNDLRNKAANMGGNRVVLMMKNAAYTGGAGAGGGGGAETNVSLTGNVYRCPGQ